MIGAPFFFDWRLFCEGAKTGDEAKLDSLGDQQEDYLTMDWGPSLAVGLLTVPYQLVMTLLEKD